jgi:hypothetical protein
MTAQIDLVIAKCNCELTHRNPKDAQKSVDNFAIVDQLAIQFIHRMAASACELISENFHA